MNKKIFNAICLVAIAVFLITLTFIMGLSYDYFTQLQQNQLRSETLLAARGVALSGEAYFDTLEVSGYRMTWIDSEGTVLYDSAADTATMENHLQREEVRQALAEGYRVDTGAGICPSHLHRDFHYPDFLHAPGISDRQNDRGAYQRH